MTGKDNNKAIQLGSVVTVQVVTMLIAVVSMLIDGIMTGIFLGDDCQAAYGLTNPVSMFLVALGGLLASGSQVIGGRLAGRKDNEGLDRILTTSVFTGVAGGLLVSVIISVFINPICLALGATSEPLTGLTGQYLKGIVFCPNHQTHFDGLFVWTALGDKCPQIDRFGCLAKAEHLDNKITAVMMKTLGGIPVERTGNTIDSTQRSIDYIKEGNWFLLHPEGTRTRDGKLGAFKEGAARIALETGMTIIPVAIVGGYEIWPYDRTLPDTYDKEAKRKRTLKIVFCPEVQTTGRSPEEITREIREKIERCRSYRVSLHQDRDRCIFI